MQDAQGKFDVFRFQAVGFLLLVGAYLLSLGLTGLEEVTLHPSILTLLGLSQVTYIAGKAVITPKWAEFDDQISKYRKLPKANRTKYQLRLLRLAFDAVFGYPPQIHIDKDVEPDLPEPSDGDLGQGGPSGDDTAPSGDDTAAGG